MEIVLRRNWLDARKRRERKRLLSIQRVKKTPRKRRGLIEAHRREGWGSQEESARFLSRKLLDGKYFRGFEFDFVAERKPAKVNAVNETQTHIRIESLRLK